MKILVAGGAGFIGSVIIPKLADRGYDVDVVDWCWFGNHLPKNIKLIKKNIFDITEEELKVYETVIFFGRSLERSNGGIFSERQFHL